MPNKKGYDLSDLGGRKSDLSDLGGRKVSSDTKVELPFENQAKTAKGAIGRFVEGVLPVGSALDLLGNTASAGLEDVSNLASGEFGNFTPNAALPPWANMLFPNVGKTLGPVVEGMFIKPLQNWSFSDNDPVAINAMQGLPVVGPALDSIAQATEEGNYAGALGQGVGLAAPTAIGKFRQSVGIPKVFRNPNQLREAATAQYIDALAPHANVETLATAKQVAPELLKRNVWAGSLPRLGKQVEGNQQLLLEKKAAEEAAIREGSKPRQVTTTTDGIPPPEVGMQELPSAKVGQRLADEQQKFGALVPESVFGKKGRELPYLTPTDLSARRPTIHIETTIDNTIDAQKLINDTRGMRNADVYVKGTDVIKGDAAKARMRAYDSFIQLVEDLRSEFGNNIPADRILDVKGEWMAEVKDAGGYMKSRPPMSPKVKAKKGVVHELKTTLDKKFEKLGAINEEYSFWTDVKKLTDRADKVRGVDPVGLETGIGGHVLGQTLRKGAGAGASAVGTVMLPFELIKKVSNLVRSPGWKMWSAHRKYQLAEAVASGNRYKLETMLLVGNKSLDGSKNDNTPDTK